MFSNAHMSFLNTNTKLMNWKLVKLLKIYIIYLLCLITLHSI